MEEEVDGRMIRGWFFMGERVSAWREREEEEKREGLGPRNKVKEGRGPAMLYMLLQLVCREGEDRQR